MYKRLWDLQLKVIPIALSIVLIFTGIFSVAEIGNLQGNARVINYTGIVRGATQRLIKQELYNITDDRLISDLDDIISELGTGDGENGLVRLESSEYQQLILQMQSEWIRLKQEIYRYREGGSRQELFKLSEDYFELANEATFAAEKYAEKRVQRAKSALLCTNLVFAMLAVMSVGFSSALQKKRERLLADEEANRRRSTELEKIFDEVRAPMDEISELMYITDPNTYELLFINNAGRESFHIDKVEGQKCYRVLQGLEEPCSFCTTPLLEEGKNYTWEYTNPILGRHFLLKDRLIEWEGRRARLEIAFDMTEAENEKIELQNMLNNEKAIVESIQELYQNRNLAEAISFMLRRMGQFLSAERAYIIEIKGDSFYNTYEWCREGIEPQMSRLQDIPISYMDRWIKVLEKGSCIIVENLEDIRADSEEEYCILKAQNIERLVAVPLEQDNHLSAYIGVDNPPPERLQNAVSFLQTIRYFLMLAIRRDENEQDLEKLSYYDTLTSFYNRNRYMQDINALSHCKNPVGVVYLDINGLKEINDNQGHDAGDQALRECAGIIQETFSESFLYRIGGDEFVIICMKIEEERFFNKVAELKLRFKNGVGCKAAVGSQWTESCEDIQSLITAADERMYADKKAFYHSGKNSGRYRHRNDDVLHLADPDTLKQQIAENRFTVYLQPKFFTKDCSAMGAEALVRYQLNEDSMIMPEAFIPLLEETRTIGLVDIFVFETICARMREWKRQGKPILPVSVNFTRCSLAEPSFAEQLTGICEAYGISTDCLEIEVTEKFNGEAHLDIRNGIKNLRKAGFCVAIDDFGIEFSNLSLFSSVDFDVLKIDRSLIENIWESEKSRAIVEAMSNICQRMDIQLVAEGVEREEQLEILKQCGVEVAQGFLLSRPVPIGEYEETYLNSK